MPGQMYIIWISGNEGNVKEMEGGGGKIFLPPLSDGSSVIVLFFLHILFMSRIQFHIQSYILFWKRRNEIAPYNGLPCNPAWGGNK